MENKCIRCLLREMAEEDYKKIEQYKAAIKSEDKVSDEVYEKRLTICKQCDRLNAGTCAFCGCYVELRAMGIKTGCPNKKW